METEFSSNFFCLKDAMTTFHIYQKILNNKKVDTKKIWQENHYWIPIYYNRYIYGRFCNVIFIFCTVWLPVVFLYMKVTCGFLSWLFMTHSVFKKISINLLKLFQCWNDFSLLLLPKNQIPKLCKSIWGNLNAHIFDLF